MISGRGGGPPAAPTLDLAVLQQTAAAATARLSRLKRELSRLQRLVQASDASRLVRVNARLVVAALRAETIAQGARDELQRYRRTSDRVQDTLREANGRLVLSGLNAQALEVESTAAHRRHVQFLATVAHELRNPLAPIRTAADLLQRADKDPELLGRLQGIIQRQATHMARLVEDLLDAARSEDGAFRIVQSPLDLMAPLQQALETVRPQIDARDQRLTLQLSGGPIAVVGDHARLTQVFSNLLDNASKYTPRGGQILLAVTADAHAATVRVADTGIGIGAEALPHVFDIFVQEVRAAEHDRAGLGIGLSVVRSLVRAHGGQIAVRSEGAHRGSEFEVILPRQAPASAGSAGADPPPFSASSAPPGSAATRPFQHH